MERCRQCVHGVSWMSRMVKCTHARACAEADDPEEEFCAETQQLNGGWWIPYRCVSACRYFLPGIDIGPTPPEGGDRT